MLIKPGGDSFLVVALLGFIRRIHPVLLDFIILFCFHLQKLLILIYFDSLLPDYIFKRFFRHIISAYRVYARCVHFYPKHPQKLPQGLYDLLIVAFPCASHFKADIFQMDSPIKIYFLRPFSN